MLYSGDNTNIIPRNIEQNVKATGRVAEQLDCIKHLIKLITLSKSNDLFPEKISGLLL